jgi:hypothetical protein
MSELKYDRHGWTDAARRDLLSFARAPVRRKQATHHLTLKIISERPGWRRQCVGGTLILRGQLEQVAAAIFVGLACGGVSELVRTVAISPGAAVGVAISHAHLVARRTNRASWQPT